MTHTGLQEELERAAITRPKPQPLKSENFGLLPLPQGRYYHSLKHECLYLLHLGTTLVLTIRHFKRTDSLADRHLVKLVQSSYFSNSVFERRN